MDNPHVCILNFDLRFKSQNIVRKNLVSTVVSLLTMALLFFSPFTALFDSFSPFASATTVELVGDETALRDIIDDANVPTIIALTENISLTTGSLIISANKDITLKSDSDTEFYGLICEVTGRPTIIVGNSGVLTLDGIIVTHKAGIVGSGINVTSGGKLIMYDGIISDNKDTSNGGGGVCVTNGVFEMHGGAISHNNSTLFGGGVNINPDSTFTMYDGSVISNNTAEGLFAGGVCIEDAVFTMYGGMIANNTLLSPFYSSVFGGGGVYVRGVNSATFAMYGGEISGNIVQNTDGGGVYVGDKGEFIMEGGNIFYNRFGTTVRNGGGVYVSTGGTFTMSKNSAIFSNSGSSGSGVYNRGVFEMNNGLIANNTANMNGGGVCNDGGSFKMFGGVVFNNTASSGGGVYNMVGGVFELEGGDVINNNSTSASGGGGVNNGGTFTMSGGTILNNTAGMGGGVYNFGNFTAPDGLIKNNTARSTGGGVYNSGNFTMSNYSEIFNNTAVGSGGGVYNGAEGNFTLYKGVIANNTAGSGGGVYNYVSSREFIMYNGVIANNTATTSNLGDGGGGVHNTGNVKMYGGLIVYNKEINGGGGGVYNYYSGNFTMFGGTIANNTAIDGGGVYNFCYSTSIKLANFTMFGGTIANNTANNGGGVYNYGYSSIAYANFTMSGGIIANNTANRGGGVYVYAYGESWILGGEISSNTAVINGGGIWITDSSTNLLKLFVDMDVVFSNNNAATAYDINPLDVVTYNAQIKSPNWTEPFEQGYNNYDISYVAGLQLTIYYISYNPNAGIGSMSNTAALHNKDVTLKPNIFSKTGYTFVGWNTQVNGLGALYDDEETFNYAYTADLELFAQWSPNNYAISYNANGGSGSAMADTPVTFDTFATLRANAYVKSGSAFISWNTQANGLGNNYNEIANFKYTIADDLELFAQWVIVPIYDFRVVYDSNRASGGNVPVDNSVYGSGASVTVAGNLGGLVRSGYNFMGWAYSSFATTADFVVSGSSVAPSSFTIYNDVTLFAVWTPVIYTVSYQPGAHGTFTAQVTRGLRYGDATPTAPVVTGEVGWNFTGWSPVFSTTVTGDANYVAQWVQITTSSPSPTTTVSPSPSVTATTTPSPSVSVTSSPSTTATVAPSASVSPTITPIVPPIEHEERWAVVNLVLSIVGAVLAVVVFVCTLLFKKAGKTEQKNVISKVVDGAGCGGQSRDDVADEKFVQRRLLWLVTVVAFAVIGVVVFLFTEDLSLPIGWLDKWTIVNVAILTVEIVVTLFVFKRVKFVSERKHATVSNESM